MTTDDEVTRTASGGYGVERLTRNRSLEKMSSREEILLYLGLNSRDPQAVALVLVCERYGLDPLLKHVVLIKDGDTRGNIYVTRDGLLHVAHSSGYFDGLVIEETSESSDHWHARVSVYRKDMSHPFTYPGRYPKLRKRWVGERNSRRQIEEPHPYGPEMAIKTAESHALRRAFDVALASVEEIPEYADLAGVGAVDLGASQGPLRSREELGVTIEALPESTRIQLANWWKEVFPGTNFRTITDAQLIAVWNKVDVLTSVNTGEADGDNIQDGDDTPTSPAGTEGPGSDDEAQGGGRSPSS